MAQKPYHVFTQQSIRAEAERRGWQSSAIPSASKYYCVTHPDGRQVWFKDSMPQTSSVLGAYFADDKLMSHHILERMGYHLPATLLFEDMVGATTFLAEYKTAVVKPRDAKKGQGITLRVQDIATLEAAVSTALRFSSGALLQETLHGNEYRLLTIGGTFFAAVKRSPAMLRADGQATVIELVEAYNKSRQALPFTYPLHMETIFRQYTSAELQRVPQEGEAVSFPWLNSFSLGGVSHDVSDVVHRSYQEFVERVSSQLGLSICGFDFMTDDIAKPMPQNVPLLEFNSAPGFAPHVFPATGASRHPAPALLDYLFSPI